MKGLHVRHNWRLLEGVVVEVGFNVSVNPSFWVLVLHANGELMAWDADTITVVSK